MSSARSGSSPKKKRRKEVEDSEQEPTESWLDRFKKGELYCPNPSCLREFDLPPDLVEHLKKCTSVQGISRNNLFQETLPCIICSTEVEFPVYRRHLRINHKEAHDDLKDIIAGKSATCANYKCKRVFKDPKEYLKHAIYCRPLYCCEKCLNEYRSKRGLQGHQCPGKPAESKTCGVESRPEKTSKSAPVPRWTEEQVKEHIEDWLEDFANGELTCPNTSCSMSFLTPTALVPHLRSCSSEEGIHKLIVTHGTLPCMLCEMELEIHAFSAHFRSSHVEAVNNLRLLSEGEAIVCPNYLCKKVFKDAKAYLKHAGDCEPFYYCEKCTGTYKSFRGYTGHNCPGKPVKRLERKRPVKAGKEVPDSITLVPKQTRTLPNSDFRSSFISSIETKQTFRKKSQSETDDLESSTTPSTGLENEILTPGLTPTPVQPEDDDNQKILNAEIERNIEEWVTSFKQGKLVCPNGDCQEEAFELPRDLIDHLKDCQSAEGNHHRIMRRGTLPCMLCGSEIIINDFCKHFRISHKDVHNDIKQLIDRKRVVCPNYKCNCIFIDAKEYLCHATACKPLYCCPKCDQEYRTTEGLFKHACYSKAEKNSTEDRRKSSNVRQIRSEDSLMSDEELEKVRTAPKIEGNEAKDALDQWLTNFKSGNLCCPNPSCPSKFKHPRQLVEHLKSCPSSEGLHTRLLYRRTIPCFICKKEIEILQFHKHFRGLHKEINTELLKIINGKTATCLNYKCKLDFNDCREYLCHVTTCRPLYFCEVCQQEYTSVKGLEVHACSGGSSNIESEEIMENWLKKFKSGKLFCPNSSCSNKFKHPKDLTEHLKLCMSPEGMHTRVLYRKTLPCMLCKKELDISTFHIHFRTTHKEIHLDLLKLMDGEKIRCLNYKCKKLFSDCSKFLSHAVGCQPLYLCKLCQQEYSSVRGYEIHACPVKRVTDDTKESTTATKKKDLEKDKNSLPEILSEARDLGLDLDNSNIWAPKRVTRSESKEPLEKQRELTGSLNEPVEIQKDLLREQKEPPGKQKQSVVKLKQNKVTKTGPEEKLDQYGDNSDIDNSGPVDLEINFDITETVPGRFIQHEEDKQSPTRVKRESVSTVTPGHKKSTAGKRKELVSPDITCDSKEVTESSLKPRNKRLNREDKSFEAITKSITVTQNKTKAVKSEHKVFTDREISAVSKFSRLQVKRGKASTSTPKISQEGLQKTSEEVNKSTKVTKKPSHLSIFEASSGDEDDSTFESDLRQLARGKARALEEMTKSNTNIQNKLKNTKTKGKDADNSGLLSPRKLSEDEGRKTIPEWLRRYKIPKSTSSKSEQEDVQESIKESLDQEEVLDEGTDSGVVDDTEGNTDSSFVCTSPPAQRTRDFSRTNVSSTDRTSANRKMITKKSGKNLKSKDQVEKFEANDSEDNSSSVKRSTRADSSSAPTSPPGLRARDLFRTNVSPSERTSAIGKMITKKSDENLKSKGKAETFQADDAENNSSSSRRSVRAEIKKNVGPSHQNLRQSIRTDHIVTGTDESVALGDIDGKMSDISLPSSKSATSEKTKSETVEAAKKTAEPVPDDLDCEHDDFYTGKPIPRTKPLRYSRTSLLSGIKGKKLHVRFSWSKRRGEGYDSESPAAADYRTEADEDRKSRSDTELTEERECEPWFLTTLNLQRKGTLASDKRRVDVASNECMLPLNTRIDASDNSEAANVKDKNKTKRRTKHEMPRKADGAEDESDVNKGCDNTEDESDVNKGGDNTGKWNVEEWVKKFQFGEFVCPNMDCSKIFQSPRWLIAHLKCCQSHENKQKAVWIRATLPCVVCGSEIKIREFHKHFRGVHTEANDIVQKLLERKRGICPNYKCRRKFRDASEYLKHSTLCKPLYFCNKCKQEYRSFTGITKHKCSGKPTKVSNENRKRVVTERTNLEDFMSEDELQRIRSLQRLEGNEAKERTNEWLDKFKQGILCCPNPSCPATFKQPRQLVEHLKTCPSAEGIQDRVLYRRVIPCMLCGNEVEINQFHKHFRTTHKEISAVFLQLLDGNSITCDNYTCRKQFDDANEYLMHASYCQPLYLCETCKQEYSTRKGHMDHVCPGKLSDDEEATKTTTQKSPTSSSYWEAASLEKTPESSVATPDNGISSVEGVITDDTEIQDVSDGEAASFGGMSDSDIDNEAENAEGAPELHSARDIIKDKASVDRSSDILDHDKTMDNGSARCNDTRKSKVGKIEKQVKIRASLQSEKGSTEKYLIKDIKTYERCKRIALAYVRIKPVRIQDITKPASSKSDRAASGGKIDDVLFSDDNAGCSETEERKEVLSSELSDAYEQNQIREHNLKRTENLSDRNESDNLVELTGTSSFKKPGKKTGKRRKKARKYRRGIISNHRKTETSSEDEHVEFHEEEEEEEETKDEIVDSSDSVFDNDDKIVSGIENLPVSNTKIVIDSVNDSDHQTEEQPKATSLKISEVKRNTESERKPSVQKENKISKDLEGKQVQGTREEQDRHQGSGVDDNVEMSLKSEPSVGPSHDKQFAYNDHKGSSKDEDKEEIRKEPLSRTKHSEVKQEGIRQEKPENLEPKSSGLKERLECSDQRLHLLEIFRDVILNFSSPRVNSGPKHVDERKGDDQNLIVFGGSDKSVDTALAVTESKEPGPVLEVPKHRGDENVCSDVTTSDKCIGTEHSPGEAQYLDDSAKSIIKKGIPSKLQVARNDREAEAAPAIDKETEVSKHSLEVPIAKPDKTISHDGSKLLSDSFVDQNHTVRSEECLDEERRVDIDQDVPPSIPPSTSDESQETDLTALEEREVAQVASIVTENETKDAKSIIEKGIPSKLQVARNDREVETTPAIDKETEVSKHSLEIPVDKRDKAISHDGSNLLSNSFVDQNHTVRSEECLDEERRVDIDQDVPPSVPYSTSDESQETDLTALEERGVAQVASIVTENEREDAVHRIDAIPFSEKLIDVNPNEEKKDLADDSAKINIVNSGQNTLPLSPKLKITHDKAFGFDNNKPFVILKSEKISGDDSFSVDRENNRNSFFRPIAATEVITIPDSPTGVQKPSYVRGVLSPKQLNPSAFKGNDEASITDASDAVALVGKVPEGTDQKLVAKDEIHITKEGFGLHSENEHEEVYRVLNETEVEAVEAIDSEGGEDENGSPPGSPIDHLDVAQETEEASVKRVEIKESEMFVPDTALTFDDSSKDQNVKDRVSDQNHDQEVAGVASAADTALTLDVSSKDENVKDKVFYQNHDQEVAGVASAADTALIFDDSSKDENVKDKVFNQNHDQEVAGVASAADTKLTSADSSKDQHVLKDRAFDQDLIPKEDGMTSATTNMESRTTNPNIVSQVAPPDKVNNSNHKKGNEATKTPSRPSLSLNDIIGMLGSIGTTPEERERISKAINILQGPSEQTTTVGKSTVPPTIDKSIKVSDSGEESLEIRAPSTRERKTEEKLAQSSDVVEATSLSSGTPETQPNLLTPSEQKVTSKNLTDFVSENKSISELIPTRENFDIKQPKILKGKVEDEPLQSSNINIKSTSVVSDPPESQPGLKTVDEQKVPSESSTVSTLEDKSITDLKQPVSDIKPPITQEAKTENELVPSSNAATTSVSLVRGSSELESELDIEVQEEKITKQRSTEKKTKTKQPDEKAHKMTLDGMQPEDGNLASVSNQRKKPDTKVQLSLWQEDFKNCNFRCPNASCDKKFFTWVDVIQHLHKCTCEEGLNCIILKRNFLPCLVCDEPQILICNYYSQHIRQSHPVAKSYVSALEAGVTVVCRNSACCKELVTVKDSIEHARECGILETCQKCKKTYTGKNGIDKHVCRVVERATSAIELEIEDLRQKLKRVSEQKSNIQKEKAQKSLARVKEELDKAAEILSSDQEIGIEETVQRIVDSSKKDVLHPGKPASEGLLTVKSSTGKEESGNVQTNRKKKKGRPKKDPTQPTTSVSKTETGESSADEASLVRKDEKKKGQGRPPGKSPLIEVLKVDGDAPEVRKTETDESSADEANVDRKDEKKKGRGRPPGKSPLIQVSKGDIDAPKAKKIETSESSTDEASLVKKDEKKKGRGRPSGKSSKPEISKDDIDASKVKIDVKEARKSKHELESVEDAKSKPEDSNISYTEDEIEVVKSVQSALSDLKRPPERLQSQCNYRPFIT